MSRIGKLPIIIPEKVNVNLNGNKLSVKGPKGELNKEFNSRVTITFIDNQILVKRISESKEDRSLHGLTRSLIANMIQGVTEGYSKKLEMIGIGYNAKLKGKDLELEVGYSHPVLINAVNGIEFEVEKNKIEIIGIDKQLVGEMAARIRAVREPEPYKGKGIKYVGEHIRHKVGKTG
jgi:large subunit ribosomal protein L6